MCTTQMLKYCIAMLSQRSPNQIPDEWTCYVTVNYAHKLWGSQECLYYKQQFRRMELVLCRWIHKAHATEETRMFDRRNHSAITDIRQCLNFWGLEAQLAPLWIQDCAMSSYGSWLRSGNGCADDALLEVLKPNLSSYRVVGRFNREFHVPYILLKLLTDEIASSAFCTPFCARGRESVQLVTYFSRVYLVLRLWRAIFK
jgi:hypothetical protein